MILAKKRVLNIYTLLVFSLFFYASSKLYFFKYLNKINDIELIKGERSKLPASWIGTKDVRKDIPIENVAYQIALCLQDEIRDYEKAGIKMVQVDEPAFRELVPIKKQFKVTNFPITKLLVYFN